MMWLYFKYYLMRHEQMIRRAQRMNDLKQEPENPRAHRRRERRLRRLYVGHQ
jgi:hypothetical protein